MNTTEIEKFAKNALGRLLGQSHFRILRAFANELKASGLDITAEQSRILFTLYIQDGRKQQDISDFLLQEKSSTSRLLNSLEKKGYLVRTQDMSDERQKNVYLTDKGRSIEGVCFVCAQKTQASVKAGFTQEEWDQLICLLKKLDEVVKTY